MGKKCIKNTFRAETQKVFFVMRLKGFIPE